MANHAERAWTTTDHRGEEVRLIVPLADISQWAAILVVAPPSSIQGEHAVLTHAQLAELRDAIDKVLARRRPEPTEVGVTAVEG